MSGKEIVLAPHKGFISSEIWLACRRRCLNNRQSARAGKAKNSWLAGKVKCGNCGYALTIRKAKTKWGRYFVCSHSGKHGSCKGAGSTVYADVLEMYMSDVIKKRLSEFPVLAEGVSPCRADKEEEQQIRRKIRLTQIEEEMDALLSKVPEAGCALMKHINEKVSTLDAQRDALLEEISKAGATVPASAQKQPDSHAKIWETMEYPDKQAVADALIQVIRIADGSMEITWNI